MGSRRAHLRALWSALGDAVRTGLVGFLRHGWMSAACAACLTAALLSLGTSYLVLLNLHRIASRLESQLVAVAYLQDGLSPREVQGALEAARRVGEAVLVPKEEAFRRLQESLRVDLRDVVGSNPLPDSIEVRPSRPADLPAVARALRRIRGVEEVVHGGELADRVLLAARLVRWLGGGVTAVLGLSAAVVIANTIRLTLLARRTEIEIMRLVGATDGLIRAPFLVEGVLHGLVGASAASVLLAFGYGLLARSLLTLWPTWPLVPTNEALPAAAAVLFGGGIGIAGTTSLLVTLRESRE